MVKLSHTVIFFLWFVLDQACSENCDSIFDSVVSCVFPMSDGGVSCLECWSDSPPQSASDCGAFENQFCAAFENCNCGGCDSVILAYSDCTVDEAFGGDVCQIDCVGGNNGNIDTGDDDSTNTGDDDDTATDDDTYNPSNSGGGGTTSDSPQPNASSSSLALMAGTILVLALAG